MWLLLYTKVKVTKISSPYISQMDLDRRLVIINHKYETIYGESKSTITFDLKGSSKVKIKVTQILSMKSAHYTQIIMMTNHKR